MGDTFLAGGGGVCTSGYGDGAVEVDVHGCCG
jgi:hypothetical protein